MQDFFAKMPVRCWLTGLFFRFCQDARKEDKTAYNKTDGAVRIFVVIYMGGNDNPTN